MPDFVMRDVRCPEGHFECDVLVPREGKPEDCICGLPRTVFYATAAQQAKASSERTHDPNTFIHVKLGDVTYTDRASLEAARVAYAAKKGVPVDQVVFESRGSKAEKKVRTEEMRHTAYEMRKRDGFDDARYKDYREQERRSPTPKRVIS